MQEVPIEVKKVQVLCKVLRTVSEVQVLSGATCQVLVLCKWRVQVQEVPECKTSQVQEVLVLCEVPKCKVKVWECAECST